MSIGSPYKLLALDVDGTLLNSQHQLSAATERTLRAAVGQGLHITLTTGRQYEGVKAQGERRGLHSPQITSNGAVVTLSATGETLFWDGLPAPLARRVIQIGQGLGVTVVVIQNGRLYVAAWNQDVDYMMGYGEPTPTVVPDLNDALDPPPSHIKVLAYRQDDLFEQAVRVYQSELGAVLGISRSVPYYLELTRRGVSKGSALRKVIAYLGLRSNHVLAIGDGHNDIAMFRAAGYAVAMGNSSPEVQAAADQVAATNDEDGAAKAIETLVLNWRGSTTTD